MVTAPVRREVVRAMVTRGLSERRALAVLRMSASSLRYRPAPDQNAALRARIVALAHRHRRYGAGMIYLKIRQAGIVANHKRVDRLYAEARLQIKRRGRKKVPVADRQPLVRPQQVNEVWSADFVFDRTTEGRVLKCLTIVDDATTEAVAAQPARALGGLAVTRILDRLAIERGLPTTLRTDNELPLQSSVQIFSDLAVRRECTHRQAESASGRRHVHHSDAQSAPSGVAATELHTTLRSRRKVRALSTRSRPRRPLAKGSVRLVSPLRGSGDSRCRS
jgi:transposase InsO family protein